MSHLLIPRLSTPHAGERFLEVQEHLAAGEVASALALVGHHSAAPNATGGKAATPEDLTGWRRSVLERLGELGDAQQNSSRFSGCLGQAIEDVIQPIPSDAAHDGVWSFLTLCLFPDVVEARWPLDGKSELSRDRWIGAQMGRDRNYLKVAWRRWRVLGEILFEGPALLGEDELVQLMERTAVARNPRIIRIAARKILDYEEDGARMGFAREFMKRVTWETGPRHLDFLHVSELQELVDRAFEHVLSVPLPRRAAIEVVSATHLG